MRLNILFWNVQHKDLTAQLVNLAQSREVDIFVLAENPVSSVRLIQALNTERADYFQNHPLSNCRKITIITKFDYDFITPVEEDNRVTIRLVNLPSVEPFMLTALHLGDKRSFSAESQMAQGIEVADFISQAEQYHGNDRTVVLGDFNMNPFETGMVMAKRLLAELCQA
jgi:endonuclease/exonuclease/phosphatase family metal-dependent hydrolase